MRPIKPRAEVGFLSQLVGTLSPKTRNLTPLLLALLAGCSGGAESKGDVALNSPSLQTNATLTVISKAIQAGKPIPAGFGGYGQGKTPDLAWSDPPTGTKSLAVLVEDPDAPGSAPFVHWLITDIPASAASVPGPGMVGTNSDGKQAYYPPTPPAGPPHHYHFEVFALDISLPRDATTREAFLPAIKGHVLAKGELIAPYQKP